MENKIFDLNKLSEKDLKALAAEANGRLTEIEAERQKLLERKRNYALVSPEPTYTFAYRKFHKLIIELANNDPALREKIDEIENICNEKDPPNKEEVYPCPECGDMALYPGNFGNDSWSPGYQITCSTCDFTAPVKPMFEEHDAWYEFHEWLVKEGYLTK